MTAKNTYGLEPDVYARLYASWQNMNNRCLKPKARGYKNYGGRGIAVCDEWKNDFHTFAQWALTNGWEDGMTIERINVNGNYEPSNCKYIPWKEQVYNKTDTLWITYRGETKSLTKWCKELGVSQYTASTRYHRDGIRNPELLFAPPKSLCKKIVQYNRNGEIIGEYSSIAEASKITGINRRSISNNLHGWSKYTQNTCFKTKEELKC